MSSACSTKPRWTLSSKHGQDSDAMTKTRFGTLRILVSQRGRTPKLDTLCGKIIMRNIEFGLKSDQVSKNLLSSIFVIYGEDVIYE